MSDAFDGTRALPARPRNWGLLPGADVRGEAARPDGTAAVVTLKLATDGTIVVAQFKSRGIRETLPLLSRVVTAAVGRKLADVARWQVADAAGALKEPAPAGGVGRETLELACAAYRAAGAAHAAPPAPAVRVQGDRVICYCMDVSAGQIVAAIRAGARSVGQVTDKTAAGGGCGTCRPDIQELLREEGIAESPSRPTGPPWQGGGAR